MITSGNVMLTWQAGQTSVLDRQHIENGRDVGNVIVQRQQGGMLVDVPYDVTFAFAFHAFRTGAPIYKETSDPGVK